MKSFLPQKILSAFLVFSMLFSLLSVKAFADTYVNATEKAGNGSIVVAVYDAESGTVGDGSQTPPADVSKPVKGVGINALRIGSVVELTTTTDAGQAVTQVAFGIENSNTAIIDLLQLNGVTAIAEDTAGGVKYYKPQDIQAAVDAEGVQGNIESHLNTQGNGAVNKVTGDDGTVTFEGLPYGIYLLAKSALPAESTTDLAPFLVSLPMYVEDDWTGTVYAYPKVRTQEVTITKNQAHGDSYVDASDIIPFTITVKIPQTTASDAKGDVRNFNKLVITDTNANSTLSIQNGKDGVTVQRNNSDFAAANYTSTYENGVLTLTLTAAGLDELNKGLGAEQTLTISYNAVVNTGVSAFHKQLTNQAVLTYNRGTTTDSPDAVKNSENVALYTYGTDLTKQLSDGGTIEANAISFALYSDADCKNQIKTKAGTVGHWPTTDAGENEMYVDTNGHLYIYGIDPGTYYLKEVKTQDGYTLLSEPIEIVVTAPAGDPASNEPTATVNTAAAQVSNGVVSLSVTNTKSSIGFTLPKTGGEGTLFAIVVGLGLLSAAVVLLVVYRKKMSN